MSKEPLIRSELTWLFLTFSLIFYKFNMVWFLEGFPNILAIIITYEAEKSRRD
jgi:hypothetical protein